MDSNENTPTGSGQPGDRSDGHTTPTTPEGGAAPQGGSTRQFPSAGAQGIGSSAGAGAFGRQGGDAAPGANGDQGYPGAQGGQEYPGAQGYPGGRGAQDTQSFAGAQGAQGYATGQGAQGYAAGQGPQGYAGGARYPGSPQYPGGAFGGGFGGGQPSYVGAPGPDGGVPGAATETKRRGPGALTALGIVAAMVIAGGVGGVVGANVGHSSGTSVIGNPAGAQSVPASAPTDGTVESVASKVLPSVVSITAVGRSGGGEGSGVVLTSDGKILTNNHVVAAAGQGGQLQVSFNDGQVAEAKVVGTDPTSDIAVIQVSGRNDLTPVSIGASSNLQVGQDVVAIGSPLGLSGTVTTGIVSSLNRPVMAGGADSGQATVIDAIQTDAAINPGNSGGALVDMGGNLVGMNSAIASLGSGQESGSIGLGFAIPVEQAQRIAQQLIDQGYATRAVLGASIKSDSSVLGAQIASVEKGSAAEKAGLPGDAVVTKLNDRTIDSGDALVAAVRSQKPGDTVSITYHEGDNGPEKSVDVTLGEAK